MDDEPRIKINLHDIFPQHSRTIQQEEISNDRIAQEQPSLQQHLISIDFQQINNLSQSPTTHAKLNRTIQSNISAETQILNLTKLIKQKEITIKKIQHVDPNKITAKLFQQKSQICSRSIKKQNSTHCACKEPPNKQQKDKSNEAKAMKTSRSNLSKSNVHERLYNMSKSQHLKMMYMPTKQEKTQNKSHRKSSSSLASSKYLKNYVPFEKRLEEYLYKDYLTASQSILKTEMDFQPKLIPSKYKDRVSSRYMQGQLRDVKASDFADFMNSSVSSSCVSATSKSAQIAQRIEDHFIRKMKLIFVKAPFQIIEVDESIIGLLTEIEFSILQPFIMQLEENGIKGEDFQTNLQAFYANLSPGEKMQLRNHELKNKSKYRELKKEIKQQKSPKKELFKVIERPYVKHSEKHLPKKQIVSNSNYHIMIQNFI